MMIDDRDPTVASPKYQNKQRLSQKTENFRESFY